MPHLYTTAITTFLEEMKTKQNVLKALLQQYTIILLNIYYNIVDMHQYNHYSL